MKSKVLIWIAISLLLAGCSANKTQVQPVVPEQSQVKEELPKTTEETAQESTQEPYVLSFEATTVDGEPVTSDIFSESKLTMINIWATYCNPCLMEMPDLGDIAQEYDKSDFQLIGIVSDVVDSASQSDIDNVKELIAQTHANYPHLLLNQSLFENLVGGVSSVPTTFFVNQKGEVIGYIVGANDEDTWEQMIDELLAKTGAVTSVQDTDEKDEEFDDE